MRFGLKIGEHDLAIKLAKVDKFLAAGCYFSLRLTAAPYDEA